MRYLVGFGLPYTASAIVGAGAQLLVPVLVLNELSSEAVGFYRAAATISVGYLAFVLTTIAQDHYPRVAAAASPREVAELVDRRMRLVLAVAVPIVLATMALGPTVIEVLYSDAFGPAAAILEWQLVGDLLKLPGWILALVLLARAGGRWYFAIELIGGAALVVATIAGIRWLGIEGAGVAYLVSFGIYYPIVWMMAQRWAPTQPGRLQLVILVLVGLAVGLNLAVASDPGLEWLRTAILLAAAATIALMAWPRLWRHHRAGLL